MDFSLAPEQEALRTLSRTFAYDDVRPTARALERHADPAACYPQELIRRADGLGLRTLKIPRRYGGLEADCLTEVVVLEELCTGDTGFGMTLQHAWREGYALACLTTDEQRERYLPQFLSVPDYMTSLAMSEAECGSDTSAGHAADLAAGPRTTVRREGGEWVLNGQKRWITNGVNARVFLVVARTDRAVPWPEGISVFLGPSVVLDGGSRGVDTTAPATPPGVALCEQAGAELAAAYGRVDELVAAHDTTRAAFEHWADTRFGREGPARASEKNGEDVEPAALCYFSGDFSGVRKGPPGSTTPPYTRLAVFVTVAGGAERYAAGEAHNLPVDEAPPSG